MSNTSSSNRSYNVEPVVESSKPSTPTKQEEKRPITGGLKLTPKSNKTSALTQVLKEENVEDTTSQPTISTPTSVSKTTHHEKVHAAFSEQISITQQNEGAVDIELKGELSITLHDENNLKVNVHLNQGKNPAYQFKTHPNIDKTLYSKNNLLALKSGGKGYPVNTPTGILKYRMVSTSEDALPLSVSVWPVTSGGETVVTVEHEKKCKPDLVDVVISIPIPGPAPVVGDMSSGTCDFDAKKNILYWRIPLIDSSDAGSLEFTVPAAKNQQFFPLNISFQSNKTLCDVSIVKMTDEEEKDVKFSQQIEFVTSKFEITFQ